MGISVGDEIACSKTLCEIFSPAFGNDDCHGVEEDGWAAIYGLINRQLPSCVVGDPSYCRANELHIGVRGLDSIAQLAEQNVVGTVAHQDSEFASCECLGVVGQDAQCGGRGESLERAGELGSGRQSIEAYALRHITSKIFVDVSEGADHAVAYGVAFALAELEDEGVADVRLLDRGLTEVELPRLAEVVREAFGPKPARCARFLGRKGHESTIWILAGTGLVVLPRVGLVVRPGHRIGDSHVAVLLEVCDRALGSVYRQVRKVRAAESLDLGVQVGEVASLKKRIVREVDPGDDVLRAEGNLLGLREEIVDRAIQNKAAHRTHRNFFLGDEFRRVEHVKGEGVGELLVEELKSKPPVRKVAGSDRFPKESPGII